MSLPPHDRVAMLRAGRLVAAELAGEAINPAVDLSMADRLALATLALAVNLEASRRAGVESVAEVRKVLAGALADVMRPPPCSGATIPRG